MIPQLFSACFINFHRAVCSKQLSEDIGSYRIHVVFLTLGLYHSSYSIFSLLLLLISN